MLCILRYIIIYGSNQIANNNSGLHQIQFNVILTKYFASISRLDTPLPFIIFWFINYFFTGGLKKEAVEDK
jgi:hypothetical protein